MGKFLIPFVVVIIALSTVTVAVVGEYHFRENPDKICVKSRSCAINYMNKLEESN